MACGIKTTRESPYINNTNKTCIHINTSILSIHGDAIKHLIDY